MKQPKELNALKLAFGNIVNELNAKISEAEQVQKIQDYLVQQEYNLRAFEQKQDQRKRELDEQAKKQQEEQDYNDSYYESLQEKELALAEERNELSKLEEKRETLALVEEQLKRDAIEIDRLKKVHADTLDKKAKVDEMEKLVKEKLEFVDAQTKLFEAREKRISEAEQRLKIATSKQ